MIRNVTLCRINPRLIKGIAAALHIYGDLGIGRFFQKHDLALNDALAFQPDFFGGVAVNDHRARVNARFQDCQHRAGKLGNGLAERTAAQVSVWAAGVL